MISATFQKLHRDLVTAVCRFPLAVLSSLLLTIVALNVNDLFVRWQIETFCSSFSLGVLLFVSLQLFCESYQWKSWSSSAIGIPILGLVCANIYKSTLYIFPVALMGLGLLFFTMIAPFLKKNVNKDMIWQYNYRLWSHYFFSSLATLVISLGLFFLLLSLDYLFHFQFFDNQYFQIEIVAICFILPMIVMAGIPTHFDEVPDAQEARRIQLLLDYVLTPILLIFGLIIICYAIKIVALQNLPRGKVSYLVSILGGAGILAYVLGDSGKAATFWPHRAFRKSFFLIMIIPLALMGFGIVTRIHQYGFTEFRYVDALLFLWLIMCVLYSFLCTREKLHQFMFVSAGTLLILGSFGPWGVMEMSTRSQIKRLEDLLEKKQILVNKKIQKNHPLVTDGDAYEITSQLNYVIARGKANHLKRWFGPQADILFKVPNQGQISADTLVREMGISREGDQKTQPFDIVIRHSQYKPDLIFVEGYTYVLPNLSIFSTQVKGAQSTHELPNSGITLDLRYDQSDQMLTLKRVSSSKPLISVPVGDVLMKLKGITDPAMIDKNLTYEGAEGPLKVRLLIQYIQGDRSHQPSYAPFHYMMVTVLVQSGK